MTKLDNSSANELKEWQSKWRCKLCKDEIYSRFGGEFVSCKCRSISVDQTPYYSRYIGDPNFFISVETGKSFAQIQYEAQENHDKKTPKE